MGNSIVQQLTNNLWIVLVAEGGKQRDLTVEIAVALVANLRQHFIHLKDEWRVKVFICFHAPIGGIKRPGNPRCCPTKKDGRLRTAKEHERRIRDMPMDEEAHLAKHFLFAERLYSRLTRSVFLDIPIAGKPDRIRIEVADIRLKGNLL